MEHLELRPHRVRGCSLVGGGGRGCLGDQAREPGHERRVHRTVCARLVQAVGQRERTGHLLATHAARAGRGAVAAGLLLLLHAPLPPAVPRPRHGVRVPRAAHRCAQSVADPGRPAAAPAGQGRAPPALSGRPLPEAVRLPLRLEGQIGIRAKHGDTSVRGGISGVARTRLPPRSPSRGLASPPHHSASPPDIGALLSRQICPDSPIFVPTQRVRRLLYREF
mmetsp:Transcript_50131/g.162408  ORF Transcript_50131/g.162408 Transcript_50131/m.162408 type:complete len:222 (-) Transcript_50131:158-823(-)